MARSRFFRFLLSLGILVLGKFYARQSKLPFFETVIRCFPIYYILRTEYVL